MSVANTEDTVKVRTAPDPLNAYLNALYRERIAMEQHASFFDDPLHGDRVDEVCCILEDFFKRKVNYITARGVNRSPFDSIKMSDVGRTLSGISRQDKWDMLYGPLKALGDIDVVSHNGHLIVRVYPQGKMPKKISKNSVYRWY